MNEKTLIKWYTTEPIEHFQQIIDRLEKAETLDDLEKTRHEAKLVMKQFKRSIKALDGYLGVDYALEKDPPKT